MSTSWTNATRVSDGSGNQAPPWLAPSHESAAIATDRLPTELPYSVNGAHLCAACTLTIKLTGDRPPARERTGRVPGRPVERRAMRLDAHTPEKHPVQRQLMWRFTRASCRSKRTQGSPRGLRFAFQPTRTAQIVGVPRPASQLAKPTKSGSRRARRQQREKCRLSQQRTTPPFGRPDRDALRYVGPRGLRNDQVDRRPAADAPEQDDVPGRPG